jgi:Uma2 family endonuclease
MNDTLAFDLGAASGSPPDVPTPARLYSAEDFEKLRDSDHYELLDGHLVERRMGIEATWIGGRVITRLGIFCEANARGWVLNAEAAYKCFPKRPNHIRKPDASFIRYGRLPDETLPRGYAHIPPDLAVEVISPGDLFEEVEAKVLEFLEAGAELIWVINPFTRTVTIHRADRTVTWLSEKDVLTGEGPLQGFSCRVAELFPPARAPIETPTAEQAKQ